MPFRKRLSEISFNPVYWDDDDYNAVSSLVRTDAQWPLEGGLYRPTQRNGRDRWAIQDRLQPDTEAGMTVGRGRASTLQEKDGRLINVVRSMRVAAQNDPGVLVNATLRAMLHENHVLAMDCVNDLERDLHEEYLMKKDAQATIASQAKEIEALETLRKMERGQWKNNIRVVVEQRTELQAENAALQATIATQAEEIEALKAQLVFSKNNTGVVVKQRTALQAENAALKKAKEEAEARGACVSCCTYTARWMYEICEHVVFCDECVHRWPGACPICRRDSERVPVYIVNGVQAGDP